MVRLVKTLSESLLATSAVIFLVSIAAITISVTGFGLRVTGGLALYFVIWWILLFAVLPFGIRSQVEAGEVIKGTEPGAPTAPGLREKAIWTTLVASVVLIGAVAIFPLAGL